MGKKIATVILILVIILVALAVYFINPFEKKRHGGLQVITNEIEASLFLNDVHLDQSPYINRKIQPGRYVLRIVPDNSDLMTVELPITLTANTLTAVFWKPASTLEESSGVVYELEQTSNRKQTELQIISEPNEAIIHFGNRDQEFAPHLFTDLETGTHSIKLSLPSYETQEQKFNLTTGYRLKITAHLGRESTKPEKEDSGTEEVNTEENVEEQESPTNHVVIQSTNFFQQEKEVLRVRDTSSASGTSVGFVEVEQKYTFFEEENDWYKISFKDAIGNDVKEGWVSGQYLEVNRVETSD